MRSSPIPLLLLSSTLIGCPDDTPPTSDGHGYPCSSSNDSESESSGTTGSETSGSTEGASSEESGGSTEGTSTGSEPGVCGDGILDPGEVCDDGNVVEGDGCTAVCTPEPCLAIEYTAPDARISVDPTGWGLGTSDFTLEFWVRHHGDFAGNRVIGMNEDYGVDTVQVFLDEDNQVICNTYSGSCPCGPGSGNAYVPSPPIDDGAWHHVACVRSGGEMELFFDGVSSGTDIIDVDLQAMSPVSLGRQGGYPTSTAAPIDLGATRFSSTARYGADFVPATDWSIDGSTVSQFLTTTAFDGTTLVDESGADNTGIHDQSVAPLDACASP